MPSDIRMPEENLTAHKYLQDLKHRSTSAVATASLPLATLSPRGDGVIQMGQYSASVSHHLHSDSSWLMAVRL